MKLKVWVENNRVCFRNGCNRFGSLTKQEAFELYYFVEKEDLKTLLQKQKINLNENCPFCGMVLTADEDIIRGVCGACYGMEVSL
jgi:ribosomal protein S27AE